MKRICILVSILVYSVTTFSQEALYYKAQKLRKNYNKTTKFVTLDADMFSMLSDIIPGDTAAVLATLRANEFVQGIIKFTTKDAASVDPFSFVKSSLGGVDVTNIVNGIADLMIERAKQELTVAFFNRFKAFAADPDHPEFAILFPKTTDNLSNLLAYNYPQMLPKLREGFFDDLKQLTYHLENLLTSDKYKEMLAKFPEVRVAIRSIQIFRRLINDEANAADVIRDFSKISDWTDANGSNSFKNIGSLLRLSAIISESVRANKAEDPDCIWVPVKKIQALVTDEITLRLYMALLYEQIKRDGGNGLKFINANNQSEDIATLFLKQKDNIFFFQSKLSEFIGLATKVNTAIKDLKSGRPLVNEDYYNYINLSLDAIDYAFGIVKMFDPRFSTDDYLAIARKSNSLYKDIYTQQYTQAVDDGLSILTQVHNLVKGSTVNMTDKEKVLDKLLTFIDKVKPYAIFMANMAQAKTSDEVKAALSNVILPVGSSTIKKNTHSNFSLQTYLGAYLSTSNGKTSSMGAWSDKFGVSATIGVAWTPGFLSWQQKGCLSVYGTVFDIGAIVDYKLRKDSVPGGTGAGSTAVTKDYSVKLGQIFSPGLYLVYGAPGNLPLSLGYGFQYGPGLAKVDAGGNTTVRNPVVRWSFFLAVDLPFFNISNRNRAKER